MFKKSGNKVGDDTSFKASQDSIMLEKTLASIGALSAVRIVRKSFPNMPNSLKRYDQHLDHEMKAG